MHTPGAFTELDMFAHPSSCSLTVALFVGACISICSSAAAADRKLADLSLDELMNEPVTSVSKKETRFGDSPAAVTVITSDDLRRLGITSIPEALRLVPGFDVARIDASHWAVSARGFNQQYANTLLVLIDGRSVYTPAFGGVYWDTQDVELADLERIEVIRGPGAALWGANAVNGVVNVITKRASETQGVFVAGSLGTEDRPSLEARYGGQAGEGVHYRVYAKAFEREGFDAPSGEDLPDDWSSVRAGGRMDWEPAADKRFTLEGEYYEVHADHAQIVPTFTAPYYTTTEANTPTRGFNVLSRWTQDFSDVSNVSVQAYVDSYDRYAESRDTVDLEIAHRFALGSRNDIVWGAGYRASRDTLHLGPTFRTMPASRTIDLYTAFVQDDITLVPAKWHLILGTKVEHNDFTGTEPQPTLRLLWTPTDSTSVWAAASRAVSTPSRFYSDSRFDVSTIAVPNRPLVQLSLLPNADLPAQKLNAYELGVRFEPAANVSVDLATFFNDYHDLYGTVPGTPTFEVVPVPHVMVPLIWNANIDARSRGVELAVNYKPLDTWRLTGSYTWLDLTSRPANAYSIGAPEQQVSLRSYATLSPRFELNGEMYYVDPIRSVLTDTQVRQIPSYVRVDAGLVFHATPSVELGLWGENLTDAHHPEISSLDTNLTTPVPRTVLVRLTAHF